MHAAGLPGTNAAAIPRKRALIFSAQCDVRDRSHAPIRGALAAKPTAEGSGRRSSLLGILFLYPDGDRRNGVVLAEPF